MAPRENNSPTRGFPGPRAPSSDVMSPGAPTDTELEAQLLRLARSRQSGTKVQAQVAAIRAVLRRRQHERDAGERAQRERSLQEKRQHLQMREQDAEVEALDDAVRRAWFELDLHMNMVRALGLPLLGPRDREKRSEAQLEADAGSILAASDPYEAFEAWKRPLQPDP
jgi:hypothetical protein